MKYSFLITFLILPPTLIAQVTSSTGLTPLPSDDILFQSLSKYYDRLLEADQAQYKIRESKNWLNYVPEFGITYALTPTRDNSFKSVPRPYAAINFSSVTTALRMRSELAARNQSVAMRNQIDHNADRIRLHQLLDQYRFNLYHLDDRKKLFQLRNDIAHIKSTHMDSLLVTPSEMLSSQQELLKQKIDLNEKLSYIRNLYWQIVAVSRYDLVLTTF